MENPVVKKSAILWAVICGVLFLFLIVHYERTPGDYWDPIIVKTTSLSDMFADSLELSKQVHQLQKEVFALSKFVLNITSIESSSMEFAYLSQITDGKIQIFKYAEPLQ